MLDLPVVAEGNSFCVETLERCLALAKEGRTGYCAIVMVQGQGNVTLHFGGLAGLEITAYWGTGLLQDKLIKISHNLMDLPVNPNAPANRIYYNLGKMSFSFDFACVLLDAEMTRIREGAPGPLRVAFRWGNSHRDEGFEIYNSPQRQRAFTGILQSLIKLIGAVEDETAIDGRAMSSISLKGVIEGYKKGEAIPQFAAPAEIREQVRLALARDNIVDPIVITLREADHSPHRNSNLPEWLKFAEWLKQQGETIIFVRDTAKAQEKLTGWTTCPSASENLLVRAALYECAKCNCFVSNGPHILATIGNRPWLLFNEIQDEVRYFGNTGLGWEKFTGIKAGGQFPWSRTNQRIIWARDTFEVMRDAWLDHIAPAFRQAAE
jgi:hypothetical protein